MTYQNPTYCQNLSVAFSHNTFFGETPKNENSRKLRLDYYLFGSPMYGRSFNSNSYKFGFNSQMKEDEIYGEGNTYSAEYWMYDSRLGRRWNIDPVDQISISNYATFRNNPIFYIDPNGDKVKPGDEDSKKELNKELKNAFGDKSNLFSYNDNNELQFTGKIRDFDTKEQRKLARGLKKLIKSDVVTNIYFASETGSDYDCLNEKFGRDNIMTEDKLNNAGGGATVDQTKTEDGERYVFIDPNFSETTRDVTKIIPTYPISYQQVSIKENRSSIFWHELGEALGPPLSTSVIKFENFYRSLSKMGLRPQNDLSHPNGIKLAQPPTTPTPTQNSTSPSNNNVNMYGF